MSQGSVTDILQDQRGFMWFGTQEGLNRYDGYTFKVYKHRVFDSASIANSYIRCIFEDRWGNLWIGTFGGGLDRYDPGGEDFVHYRHDPEDPSSIGDDDIRAITQDARGHLWIGTRGGGLQRMDVETGAFERYRYDPEDPASLGSDHVRSLLVGNAGELWVGTSGGGLNRLDLETGVFERFVHHPEDPSSLSENTITALLLDENDALWVATDTQGVNRLDRESGKFQRYLHDGADPGTLSNNEVRSLYQGGDGALWIGTASGLNRFVSESGSFERFHHVPSDPTSLSNDEVTAILEIPSGVLWVGTFGGGLNKLIRATEVFTNYRHDPSRATSLSDNQLWSVHEDHLGAIWVGTDKGLDRLDPKTGEFESFRHDPDRPASLGEGQPLAILEDQRQVLWVTTNGGGLNRLLPETSTFRHYQHDPDDPTSLSSNSVWPLVAGRGGELWVGTMDGGLNRLDPDRENFRVYRNVPSDEHSLSDDRVQSLFEDSQGTLWVGTYGSGLDRLDPGSDRFHHYVHDPTDPETLTANRIASLWEDDSGNLWVGTDGGLNLLDRDTDTFRHWTEADGLPASIKGILSDDTGHLWLSTNSGLARFDPETEEFTIFDARDGLQGSEFNSGAYAQTSARELLFGGTNGLTRFDPSEISLNTHLPPIVITAFKKYNTLVDLPRPISQTQEIELSYQDDVVSFEFAALDYHSPSENQYSILLEGFHDDWVDQGTKRDVTFTDLDHGSYTLRVRGSNNDGLWNEEGTAISLTIRPPFWEIGWVQLIALVTLVALVGLGIRTRTRRIELQNRRLRQEIVQRKEVEKEREHLITELGASHAEMEQFTYTVSHDLKSPLVTIKGFLGLVEEDASSGDLERLSSDLRRIDFAVETMSRLLADLLEVSRIGRVPDNPERVSLSVLAQEAADLIEGRAAACGAEVLVPPDLPTVVVDRRRLLTVFQNLLDNAVKFSGERERPTVEVGASEENGHVLCWVSDNGVGIDPRYHDKVFGVFERLQAKGEGTGIGLALVQRIIEARGGRIWIDSTGNGDGATFYFTLPLSQPIPEANEALIS